MLKRIISVFLCAVMCFTLLSAAVYAQQAQGEIKYYDSYDEMMSDTMKKADSSTIYPTVILPGINHSVYYAKDENGEPIKDGDGKNIEAGLVLIDSTTVLNTVLKYLFVPLMQSLLTQHDMGLSEAIYNAVGDILKYSSTGKDGKPVYDLGLYTYDDPVSLWSADEKHWFYTMLPMESYTGLPYASGVEGGNNTLEDMTYICTFPLIGDPMESCKNLKSMVDRLAEKYGKVNLVAVSLGGTLLAAYMDYIDEADYAKLNDVIGFVGAMQGTTILDEFFCRKWSLDDDYVYTDLFPSLFTELEGDPTTGYLINLLIRILPKQTLKDLISNAYSGLFDTVMKYNPQFWAMLTPDGYTEACEFLGFDETWAIYDTVTAYAAARTNLYDNLTAAAESGVSVSTIAGYNMAFNKGEYCFFGLVASGGTVNSDGIIDIVSTSLGATAGEPNETLAHMGITPGADGKYLSPDGCLDASTCLFPDSAWFFNGQHHEMGRNDVAAKLASAILTGAIDSVDDQPILFPQFNGNRNARRMVRSDYGYLVKARSVLADTTGAYTDEQKAAVGEAYDNAMSVLTSTICDADACEEAEYALGLALTDCGLENVKPAEDDMMGDMLTFMLKNMSKAAYTVYGAKGYFDWVWVD